MVCGKLTCCKGENDKYIKNMIAHYGFAPEAKAVIDRSATKSADNRDSQKESLAFRQSGQYWDDRYRLKATPERALMVAWLTLRPRLLTRS